MTKETRLFTREEVKNRKNSDSHLLIIYDKVYDVTKFLNDHPGGEEVLAEQRGKDASEAFADVGHSEDAIELMSSYKIGELVEEEKTKIEPKKSGWSSGEAPTEEKNQKPATAFPIELFVVVVIAILIALNYSVFS